MRSILIAILVLTGCGSGDGTAASTPVFHVGGTVERLVGSHLVLRINGSDQRMLGNGPFAFHAPIADGSAYSISVRAHPVEPEQICTVANSSGVVYGADVTDVVVGCSNVSFAVGGTVAGLEGSGLLLQNNGVDVLAVDTDGAFTFVRGVEDTTAYAVRVMTQPSEPDQTCALSNEAGTMAGADVTDVMVTCATP